MREIYLTYLNRADVEAAALSDAEILATIEGSLAMQGRGETVIEPRVHLEPRSGVAGTSTCSGAGSAAGSTWPG